MTHSTLARVAAWLGALALSAALLPSAGAQAPESAKAAPPGAAASPSTSPKPDMRLWSFGECDRHFPYFASAEHQECVRVVGSEEAKDARAARVCDASYARDPAEATRCKEAYAATKAKAAQDGFRADPAKAQSVPVQMASAPRVDAATAIKAVTKAITAPEPEEAAAAAPAPEAQLQPAAPASGMGIPDSVLVLAAVVLVLAGIGMRFRRKEIASMQGGASARRGPTTRQFAPTRRKLTAVEAVEIMAARKNANAGVGARRKQY